MKLDERPKVCYRRALLTKNQAPIGQSGPRCSSATRLELRPNAGTALSSTSEEQRSLFATTTTTSWHVALPFAVFEPSYVVDVYSSTLNPDIYHRR